MTIEPLPGWINFLMDDFILELTPFEQEQQLVFCIFCDMKTKAWFCECHIKASKLARSIAQPMFLLILLNRLTTEQTGSLLKMPMPSV